MSATLLNSSRTLDFDLGEVADILRDQVAGVFGGRDCPARDDRYGVSSRSIALFNACPGLMPCAAAVWFTRDSTPSR